MTARLLIVDDEEGIRVTLRGILEDEGYDVALAEDGATALAKLRAEAVDLAILDLWLPDLDGLQVLESAREFRPDLPVIVISGHGKIDSAVRAIRLGAYDFLEKPLALGRVLLTVQNALEHTRMVRQIRDLSDRLDDDEETLLGASDRMQRLISQLELAAASDSRILITGENGTGKELVARQIHRNSPRAAAAFVDVNCAAIPEELIESELFGHKKGAFTGATEDRVGRFEQAHGGTLFLDEVADMSLKTQAKVLRVLEEQRFERVGDSRSIGVDVRVLAATNKDLVSDEIPEGRFREDLYFRLAVIPLSVPPLRERGADISALVEHFIRSAARTVGRRPKTISREAAELLQAYSWPGNVRELKNLAERLVIMSPGDVIGADDLPANLRTGVVREGENPVLGDFENLRQARDEFERLYISRHLEEREGNVSKTAEALGIERSHLHRKIRAYGIVVKR